MKRLLVDDADKWLNAFSNDPIRLTDGMIVDWLVKKGSKVELVADMLRNVANDENAISTKRIKVHYKKESLLKEQVNDILDQVGRVIVWNNQNINMFACPVVNEAKNRLKMILRNGVHYADGLPINMLNNLLRTFRAKHILEMDLSKQDRQTDTPILKYEYWLICQLGVPIEITEYLTQFIPKFTIRGSNNERTVLPPIHFSGGAMTSLGNEIRNLLLIADVVQGHRWVAIFTLGDDSIIFCDSVIKTDDIKRMAEVRHNVVATVSSNDNYGKFLQLIVTRDGDGGFYATHDYKRLREKLAYSPYPNHSTDWKMKYASFMMMVGRTKMTTEAMKWAGFVTFPRQFSHYPYSCQGRRSVCSIDFGAEDFHCPR